MQASKVFLLLTDYLKLAYLPKYKINLVARQKSKTKMYSRIKFETLKKIQNENEFLWAPTASLFPTNSGRLLPVTHCGAAVGTPLRAKLGIWAVPAVTSSALHLGISTVGPRNSAYGHWPSLLVGSAIWRNRSAEVLAAAEFRP